MVYPTQTSGTRPSPTCYPYSAKRRFSSMHGYAGWSESSLSIHVILLVLLCSSANRKNLLRFRIDLWNDTQYLQPSEIDKAGKNCCNYPESLTLWFYYEQMSNIHLQNGKQCRSWSDFSFRSSLMWACTVGSYLSVPKLKTFTVNRGGSHLGQWTMAALTWFCSSIKWDSI